MCEPTTLALISTGLGIAGSVMQFGAQKNQYEVNKKNADVAFVSEQETLQRRSLQEQDSAAQAKQQMQQEARSKVAESVNAASDAGTAGLSVSGLVQGLQTQEAQRQLSADTNLEWTLSDLNAQKKSSGVQRSARIDSVSKPSVGSLALGIGNAVLGGFNSYYQTKSYQK